ncbi:TPA: site-specific integrase [Vibrio parahaemolyticus]|uniref:tyrosine-type recombinase/integrase n=1 Tax=Vibrio diabolicus TaxID=50719 RepID=UPI001B838638|nr:site-specific integrase [Vibrio parahaemolyticus]HBC3383033.1 site-specific integrase [Vibrio parahaemolyticus]HBC3402088.1 site-specific integrase [Vibrio parahaemolyticus]HBC3445105.1 site-specific integrase [Vibrio parahaemolyticus]HBC3845113.1 site-specific integrase [Vibrio parahaemolyticus]
MATIRTYIKDYMDDCREREDIAGYDSKQSKANNIIHAIGHRAIQSVTQKEIKAFLRKGTKKWQNRTLNGHLTILRAIFDNAYHDRLIDRNPMNGIKNYKTAKKEIQPFTKEEIKAIYDSTERYVVERALFILGVLTGLRISELIALCWCCVDLERKLIIVRRAKVKGQYKVTKTVSSEREVELCDKAVAVLQELQLITGKRPATPILLTQEDKRSTKRENVKHVFICLETGKAFIDDRQYAKRFLTPTLAKLNIAHRGPGQIRHTFASQALTAGLSDVWIARQLGHTTTLMVHRHYAKYIREDAPDNTGKLASALSSVFDEPQPEPQPPAINQEMLSMLQALTAFTKLTSGAQGGAL